MKSTQHLLLLSCVAPNAVPHVKLNTNVDTIVAGMLCGRTERDESDELLLLLLLLPLLQAASAGSGWQCGAAAEEVEQYKGRTDVASHLSKVRLQRCYLCNSTYAYTMQVCTLSRPEYRQASCCCCCFYYSAAFDNPMALPAPVHAAAPAAAFGGAAARDRRARLRH
jgi:hypothetical protein